MNTKYFKKRLEEEKAKLESEMSSIGRRNPLVSDDWEAVPGETGAESDSIDQADDTAHNEENAGILADLEARYDTILVAERNLEKGTYGVCEICGGDIEETRLTADPAATTCIAHK